MDYYAIVEEKVSKKMNIISCDDLFDFDLTWVNDSTQWPGAHQTSAKKKSTVSDGSIMMKSIKG